MAEMGVPEFYKGRSVFVTGFTGYLGKLIVEKLLYSCADISKIYVLVRPSRGKEPIERTKHVTSSLAFNRLKEKQPKALETKLITLKGDVLESRLGLSDSDIELLKKDVSIIFHGAASVRFDDHLDEAVRMNTNGTKEMAEIALAMPKLECLCYISTAYTNCDFVHIKEAIYPPKADWKETIKISETIDRTTFNILSRKYLDKIPNTYAFSKSLAEQVINAYRNKLPVVILRPSIVIGAINEPLEGWVDSINGAVALWIGASTGVIRCGFFDEEAMINCIPSDYVVNSTILAARKTALTYDKNGKDLVPVYNACLPVQSRISNGKLCQLYRDVIQEEDDAKEDIINFFYLFESYNLLWFSINVLFRHVLPALFVDLILVMLKMKPMLLKIRRKISIQFGIFDRFMNYSYIFENDKFNNLLFDLNPKDRDEFGWTFENWEFIMKNLFKVANRSTKQTILKPVYDDFITNKKRLGWLLCIDKAAVYLTYSLIAWIIYWNGIPQTVCSFLLKLVYF